ncbi:hypothetical protein [Leptospira weilii]|uniref:hypothetical protein n=1 Tax=Leptospira weilii TaxID=28184 RepID=UPI00056B2EFA
MKAKSFPLFLGGSILCNFAFAYEIFKKPRTETVQVGAKSACEGQENGNKKEFLSTAEALPHPPVFLEGRKIRFLSYSVKTENGKKWILFKEKRGNGITETKIDAEAVRWF